MARFSARLPKGTYGEIHFDALNIAINNKAIQRQKKEFERILEEATKRFEDNFKQVSDTFQNQKVSYARHVAYGVPPNFSYSVRSDIIRRPTGRVLYGITWGRNDAFYYLDVGTRVRYRVMSRPWRSKTWSRSGLRTRGGVGIPTGFAPEGRPGIKPRYIAYAAAQKEKTWFNQQVRASVKGIAKVFFLGTRVVYL